PGGHAARGPLDRARPPRWEQPEPSVHTSGGLLDERVATDERRVGRPAREMEGVPRALGEGAPERATRHLDRAEAVALDARGVSRAPAPPHARSLTRPCGSRWSRAPGRSNDRRWRPPSGPAACRSGRSTTLRST